MAGLAETVAAPQPGPQGLQQGVPTVDEVVALLMQGIPPEELVQMGVPEQLLMEAIDLLKQQMAAEQAAAQQGPQGLAGSLLAG